MISRSDLEVAAGATNHLLAPYGAGFDPDEPVASIEGVIHAYFKLGVKARRTVGRVLTRLGLGSTVEALTAAPETPQSEPYTCGTLGTTVVSPCRHETCRFHLPDAEEHHHCLMVASSQAEMDVYDIAAVLDMEQGDVQDAYLTALRVMRRQSVVVATEHAELRVEFVLLQSLRVCAVCEETVDKPFMVERGFAFCSPECSEARNPAHVLIEARSGIPADKLIRWVRRKFDTIEAAAQALNFPPSVLSEALSTGR